jgi:hypothetical protein
MGVGRRQQLSTSRGGDPPCRQDVRKMKRCEEKIRYCTAAGATWSL